MIYILAISSYIVGFLFLLKIRSYDKYEQEPLWNLIKLSFLGGIVSVGTAAIIYGFVHPKKTLFDAIFRIGTVEELSKLLTFFILYRLIKKDFDEIVDGIIYIAAISLGFSVIENIEYAVFSKTPFLTLGIRFLTATIGHISFSVYMGIAFYVHKKINRNYLGLILAFAISTLGHGLYDGFIFNKDLKILFFPTFIFFIYLQFRLLKVAYAYSKKKKKIQLFFNEKDKISSHNTYCCNCETNQTSEYIFNNKKIEICDTCNHIILEYIALDNILKYYRPKFNRKLFFSTYFSEKQISLNQTSTIKYNTERKRLNADKFDFAEWLIIGNKQDLLQYHKTFEGIIFNLLGFRYIS